MTKNHKGYSHRRGHTGAIGTFGRIEIAIERRISGQKQTFSEQTFHNIRSA